MTTTYRYDDAGQRLTKQVGTGNIEVYLLDGTTTLAVATVDASGTATSWYFNLVWENRIVGRQPNTGSRSYYHMDVLGNTRAVVQGATVVESYDYDPWGVLLAGRTLGSGTKEQFGAKERDSETGLDYFGARYYMSALGRWAAVDPAADSMPEWSSYDYVYNNPVMLTDRYGLSAECPVCALVAAAWALYELGSSVYDVYQAGKTIVDDKATTGQKVTAVGLAAIGFVAPGGGYTKAAKSLEELADAAKVLERGGELTKAGRALEKHSTRATTAFERATGNAAAKNKAGQTVVEDILTSPGSRTVPLTRGRFKGGADIYAPDGRGVRYDAEGKFVGLLEPPR